MNDNYAKVQNNKWASDDDASDLLAGILDETEDDAIAEQARLDAELQAKKDQERFALASAEESRKQEATNKLSAEMNRLEGVKQKRTEKLQAIQVEELKARGEWIDPEVERQKVEALRQQEAEAMRVAAQQKAAEAAVANTAIPTANVMQPTAKSKMPLMVLGIVAVLVAVSVIVAATMLGGYTADNTSYAKAVFVPKTPETNLVEKSFTATPRKKKAAVVVDDSSNRSKSRSKSKSRSRTSRVTRMKTPPKKPGKLRGKQKKNKAASALERALKSNDIYGKDPF